MSAIEALRKAKAAGVRLTLDAPDGIILEVRPPATLPMDVVALLKAAKPDLLKILEWRQAARAASLSSPPPDCGVAWISTGVQRFVEDGEHKAVLIGVRENAWALAVHGLRRFVAGGWSDQAALLGWSKEELYRVPELWSQVHLTGAALLNGTRRVLAVTGDNIVVEATSGAQLKFRRIGREHLA
jgi:hypothetical protein